MLRRLDFKELTCSYFINVSAVAAVEVLSVLIPPETFQAFVCSIKNVEGGLGLCTLYICNVFYTTALRI